MTVKERYIPYGCTLCSKCDKIVGSIRQYTFWSKETDTYYCFICKNCKDELELEEKCLKISQKVRESIKFPIISRND